MELLPDALLCHPNHLIYPLWMKYVRENRKHFNKVIVVFTNMNVPDLDYRNYVQNTMGKGITFLDCLPAESNEDWRDKAVNMGLSVSDSEWVFFWEEDFIPQGDFWREATDLMRRTEVFGRYQEGRLHPCCFFIRRELLNRTSKDFGANGDKGYDHFALIQKWIEAHDIITGVIFSQYGHHMNGLSQNIHLLQIGEVPNYNPPEFRKYVEDCLKEDMPNDMRELFLTYLK